MAYDELLAMRVRDALSNRPGVTEKRMMGGVCFLMHGNMVCGVDRAKDGAGRFMFRIGKGNPAVTRLRGGEVVAMGQRQMPGFYFVDGSDCSATDFHGWLSAALEYVEGLPPK